MPVAHDWKGLSLNVLLTLQDGKGGFEFAGNAFKVTGAVADIDDLKKVLTSNGISFILFCGTFFQKRNDTCKAERPHLQHVL